MPSKTQKRVTLEILQNTEIFTDEYLFRMLAKNLVENMPFGELCLLFGFSKLQPETNEFNTVFNNWTTDDNLRNIMRILKEQKMALFEVEVRHPEKLPQIEYYQK